MNLSMRWLKDYVPVDMPIRDFCEKMTMSGSKVEGWEREDAEIEGVVVGRVLSLERHPDSDHLWVCQIDVGADAPLQIVTGAQNVEAGSLVPVATDGSRLPGGKEIRTGKLRGVESAGMLCSLGELGLTQHDFPYADENGIFLIAEDEGARLGQPVCEALGFDDTRVEFEITSNRPDCLAVRGLAREAAATLRLPLTLPEPAVKGAGGNASDYVRVRVDAPHLCSRYVARVVRNIKIAPSPRWLRERLRAAGVRPINNLVDITNWVCLEYGQPMHAFDLSDLAGGQIVVRRAADGERLVLLDGTDKPLNPNMLVIADAEKAIGVAGVMGGADSGVRDTTKTVVFESAMFDGLSIRLAAKALGVRTEASGRFEKGLDANNCLPAIQRACELCELLGCGEVMDGVIDINNAGAERRRLPLEADKINRFLGIDIPRAQMEDYLRAIDFGIDGDDVLVPTNRADILCRADLAEEVARFYGYDNIPSTGNSGSVHGRLTPKQRFENKLLDQLVGLGLYEIQTYSFVSPRNYDRLRLPQDDPRRNSVVITNPLGEDTSVMRTSIVPSMLDILGKNHAFRNPAVRLFELGYAYLPRENEPLPLEDPRLSLGAYGDGESFFTMKGCIESILEANHIAGAEFKPASDTPWLHPGRSARLTAGGLDLGTFGEVHPAVLENYGLTQRAYVADLSFTALFTLAERASVKYRPLPKFPATTRDLALVCPAAMPVAALERKIAAAAGDLVESVELFDVYTGAQVAAGCKSAAFSLTLRHPERTLTDPEADAVMAAVLAALQAEGISLR